MNREDIIREADAWLKMNGLVSDGQTCFMMALFAQHISALAAEQPSEDIEALRRDAEKWRKAQAKYIAWQKGGKAEAMEGT